ncbi:fungal-specific transcription factor domain-containing protein [Penicillium capsulatum]|uniref:Fungal-specific transcription factor domain-containing protein n=1 Tax=Penicillium capsulatum TaxID=69766 RepID=A0A9W9LEV4_9EURO|nr:fungal-specific transcription factor domain-containing protein [Penicillium capsulatum]KAJ6112863.1 fungal-specific transcription factor domain-containing protein [Penicillium capsulatum]
MRKRSNALERSPVHDVAELAMPRSAGTHTETAKSGYLEQLIQDSQELHGKQVDITHETQHPATESSRNASLPPNDDHESISQDKITDEGPWFQSSDSSALPIYISEAACTAFATRLCQCLRGSDVRPSKLLRGRYMDELKLSSLASMNVQWPSLASAKLLVRSALGHVNEAFHVVLRKETMDVLHRVYQKRDFGNQSLKCKYFALFAMGQAYFTHPDPPAGSTTPETVPGSTYFVQAMNLLHIIPERPTMVHIESLLLLALFCQFLNRFHSSYLLVGNALRLSLSVGLNYNVPANQNLGPMEREHRVRVWWTIYVLDRFWGCKSGFPVQIHDDDLHVDLPSPIAPANHSEQFGDSVYQTVTIELARITGNITREIYNRKKSTESFLQREQKLLIQMQKWVQNLPEKIRLHPDRPNSKYALHLHLQFSYCVILAIRPVLLNLLICHSKSNPVQSREEVTPILATLSEACIHAARFSFKICSEEWTTGFIAVYGYAFSAYLFSSALVLTISSLLPLGHPNDLASVDTAMEMLRVLSASDNLAAKDLYEHLQHVRQCLHDRCSGTPMYECVNNLVDPLHESNQSGPIPLQSRLYLPTNEDPTGYASFNHSFPVEAPSPDLTTEMTLDNPLMADFLMQSAVEVGSLSIPEIPNDFDMEFLWPGDTLCT